MGNSVNIQETIEKARKQIENEANLSPALKGTVDLLINLCLLLSQKWLTKNPKNSSIPPPADPNREKPSKAKGKLKPGGRPGHPGTTLKPVDKPDKTVPLRIDRCPAAGGMERGREGEAAGHRTGNTAGSNRISGGDSGE